MKKAQEEVRKAFKGKSKIEEPDIQNLDYLKAIIKETFRLHPLISFRTEAVNTTCLVNRSLSSTIGFKTPKDIWSRRPAKYENFSEVLFMFI